MTTRRLNITDRWVVLRDGRIASAHRSLRAARRAAKKDGIVLSVEPAARRLGLRVGDEARDSLGQVLPR